MGSRSAASQEFGRSGGSSATSADTESYTPSIPEDAPAPAVLTRDQQMQETARRIDEEYARLAHNAADAELNDPSRAPKWQWRPDIDPKDPEWLAARVRFRRRLKTVSMAIILDEDFEEAQRLYIIPPVLEGPTLRIQNENAEKYKAAFLPGAKFYNVPDNLATKLTMVRFGLPIAPVTQNNIVNGGQENDEDDMEDDPEEVPNVRRIVHSEPPLGFLDEYNERAYGYPMLRKRVPRSIPVLLTANLIGVRGVTEAIPKSIPIMPVGDPVGMRGGAGPKSGVSGGRQISAPAAQTSGSFLYAPDGTRVLVESDDVEGFERAVEKVLKVPAVGEIWFHADFYENRKREPTATFFETLVIRPNNIDNYYERYVRPIIFNTNINEDWMVFINDPRKMGESAASRVRLSSASETTSDSPFRIFDKLKGYSSVLFGTKSKPALNPPVSDSPKKALEPTPTAPSSPIADDDHDSSTSKSITEGPIYGFLGQIWTPYTSCGGMVKAAALRLLELPSDATEFAFQADFHYRSGQALKSYSIDEVNYEDHMGTEIYEFLSSDAGRIFVRRPDQKRPGNLAPSPTKADIIRLKYQDASAAGSTVCYWKIPTDLATEYGLNQIQPGFFAAMCFLFPEAPNGLVTLHPENKDLDPVDLGVENLEVNLFLWDSIKVGVEDKNSAFRVTVEELRDGIDHARLVGSGGSFPYRSRNLQELQKQIERAAPKDSDQDFLTRCFRIWPTEDHRLDGHPGFLIEYTRDVPNVDLVRALRDLEIQCPVFRSEWTSFTLEFSDAEAGETFKWNVSSATPPTLASFKDILQNNLPDESATARHNVILKETSTGEGQDRVFVITNDTTEDEWQKDIFDWLQDKIFVVEVGRRVWYKLDRRDPWGLRDVSTRESLSDSSDDDDEEEDEDADADADAEPTDILSALGVTNEGLSTIQESENEDEDPAPSFVPPTTNVPRLLKERAGEARSQTFEKWDASEREKDRLQRRSYTTDQPAVIPGQSGVVPLYGASRERQLAGSGLAASSMPTIFAEDLTASQVRNLLEEIQNLRNQHLERTWICQICDMAIPPQNAEHIAAHVKAHKDTIELDGQCMLCEDRGYRHMNPSAKKEHLKQHLDQAEENRQKKLWENQKCHACQEDFTGKSGEYIITHCLNAHLPGSINFCDKCGFDYRVQTELESAHHKKACLEKADLKNGERYPVFCGKCGIDTNKLTGAEAKTHKKNCTDKPAKDRRFHIICGIDWTGWTPDDKERHVKHCKHPRGHKGKFCSKCQQNMVTLDSAGKAEHMKTCATADPSIPAAQLQLELQAKNKADIETLRIMKAERNSKVALLKKSRDELTAREKAVEAREINLDLGQPPNPVEFMCPLEDKCPETGSMIPCAKPLQSDNPLEMRHHFWDHKTRNTTFRCPVEVENPDTRMLGACNAILDLSKKYEMDGHYAHHEKLQCMGPCPVLGCKFSLGNESRKSIRNHLLQHIRTQSEKGPTHRNLNDWAPLMAKMKRLLPLLTAGEAEHKASLASLHSSSTPSDGTQSSKVTPQGRVLRDPFGPGPANEDVPAQITPTPKRTPARRIDDNPATFGSGSAATSSQEKPPPTSSGSKVSTTRASSPKRTIDPASSSGEKRAAPTDADSQIEVSGVPTRRRRSRPGTTSSARRVDPVKPNPPANVTPTPEQRNLTKETLAPVPTETAPSAVNKTEKKVRKAAEIEEDDDVLKPRKRQTRSVRRTSLKK